MKAADISAALDDRALDVLRHLLPGGRKVGHEFVAGNLAGDAGDSLKVSLNGKGSVWSDFATSESGGDLLDLWAAARCRGDVGAAMREAAAWLRLEAAESSERPPEKHPQLGAPDHVAEYTDLHGRTIGFVYRWNARGERRKEIRPLTRRDGRWCWKTFDRPNPLYRHADLAAHPDLPVLVVEGEVKADHARDILPGCCTTTWPHGKNAVDKADLSPLKGRRLVCWPDADADGGGLTAMRQLARLALAAGAAEARIVELPAGLPDGWDLANPLPDGWTADTIEQLIGEAPLAGAAEEAPEAGGLGEWDAGADDFKVTPRAWLLGTVFCRTFLSSVQAAGGTGKTAVRTAQAVALASNRPITGEHVFQRCRVLLASFEDDADELRRRVLACLLHHGISAQDVQGYLYLAALGGSGWKLAMPDKDGVVQASVLAGKLSDAIKQLRLDVVILDPFKKVHGAPENDNTAIDEVTRLLTSMAVEHKVAIDAPHHVAKGPADPGNADKGRGASAFKDGARLVYTLNSMTPDEAAGFGIGEAERRSLIRMDSGKVNLCPSGEARWFKLVGVRLGNGTSLYPHGDEVQTIEPWEPPDTWAGLSSGTLNAMLTRIDAGMPDGERYSSATAAGDRAAWKVVGEIASDRTEKQARQIISTWLKTGLLYVEDYQSPGQRKTLKGLRVNHTKRPT